MTDDAEGNVCHSPYNFNQTISERTIDSIAYSNLQSSNQTTVYILPADKYFYLPDCHSMKLVLIHRPRRNKRLSWPRHNNRELTFCAGPQTITLHWASGCKQQPTAATRSAGARRRTVNSLTESRSTMLTITPKLMFNIVLFLCEVKM